MRIKWFLVFLSGVLGAALGYKYTDYDLLFFVAFVLSLVGLLGWLLFPPKSSVGKDLE